VIRRFSGWELERVRAAYAAFALPDLSDRARAALRVAVSRIGMPYIWGGETDGVSLGQAHGEIRPADLLFFGSHGYADHVGIAMGDDWMIHSSSQGVTVIPLATRDRGFLWGRRVV
jgi:cell wall-associated NlpC family hydrolase